MSVSEFTWTTSNTIHVSNFLQPSDVFYPNQIHNANWVVKGMLNVHQDTSHIYCIIRTAQKSLILKTHNLMHGAQNCGAGGKRPEDLAGFFLHLDGFTFRETQSHTVRHQLLTNMVVDSTCNGGQLSLGIIT